MPPASPLLPTYVARATVTQVARAGAQLRLEAVVNVDGTLSPVAEVWWAIYGRHSFIQTFVMQNQNTAGLLPPEEVPDAMLEPYRQLQVGDRIRVAIKSTSRSATAPLRCSLRPEARHQSYIMELSCQPDEGRDTVRALQRTAFFCNPAR